MGIDGLWGIEYSPLGRHTALAYDGNGNAASVQRPDGSTVTYEYDPRNLLTRVNYPDGGFASFAYDGASRQIGAHGGTDMVAIQRQAFGPAKAGYRHPGLHERRRRAG